VLPGDLFQLVAEVTGTTVLGVAASTVRPGEMHLAGGIIEVVGEDVRLGMPMPLGVDALINELPPGCTSVGVDALLADNIGDNAGGMADVAPVAAEIATAIAVGADAGGNLVEPPEGEAVGDV